MRSLRSGKYGYVNDPKISVSYDSLQEYVETLERWVKSGDLIAEKEFYSSVRLRGAKKARDLLEKGSNIWNSVCLISIRLHLMDGTR